MSDNVIILAGGSSVNEIDISRLQNLGYVLGVNDAALYASVDECITMDRLWFENRHQLVPTEVTIYMRESALKAPHTRDNVVLYKNDHTKFHMAEDQDTLNGTNSGMVAINRAYHLRPRNVYLLGFDMHRNSKGEAYWYPPYPWARPEGSTGTQRYAQWSAQFAVIQHQFWLRGINILNVGLSSKISSLPKISTQSFMRLLNE